MLRRAVWALGSGASIFLASALAHAQCTKDTDCKGDRVCEAGKCTSPALPPAPAAPTGPDGAPVEGAKSENIVLEEDAAQSPPDETAPSPGETPPDDMSQKAAPDAAVTSLGADEPQVRRRNRGMMVGGIVMVSVGPLALLGALSARNSQDNCDEALERRYPNHVVPSYDRTAIERCDSYTAPIYILGIGGALLVTAGIPMIIYGAKAMPAEPKKGARFIPWATPSSGGLSVRVDL